MKELKLVFLLSLVSLLNAACVMTPTGEVLSGPDMQARVELGPRVHIGSRSAVTVWLHPNYYIADAYTVAQRHCRRWGLWASPSYDWDIQAGSVRYLDYTCVGARPFVARPHLHRRYRYPRYYKRRRFGRFRDVRPHRPSLHAPYIRTPEVRPLKRRGTFGGQAPGSVLGRPVPRTQVGKPWQHNANKNKRPLVSPKRPFIKREVGKPWEHNIQKNQRRRGFGSTSFGRKKKVLQLRGRTSGKSFKRGRLSL